MPKSLSDKQMQGSAALKFGVSDLAEHAKIKAEAPSTKSLIQEFGESSYKTIGKTPDGREKYRIDVNGRKNVLKLFEMMSREKKMSSERAMRVQSAIPKSVLVDKQTGERREVAQWNARAAGFKFGMVEPAKYGGIPVVRGMDLMMFRRNGPEWEPTGRSKVGISAPVVSHLMPQRDPDGRPWKWSEALGDWVRADVGN